MLAFVTSNASSMIFCAFCSPSSTSFSQLGRLSTGVLTFSVSPFSVLKPQIGQKFDSSAYSLLHDLHLTIFLSYASDIKKVVVTEIKH